MRVHFSGDYSIFLLTSNWVNANRIRKYNFSSLHILEANCIEEILIYLWMLFFILKWSCFGFRDTRQNRIIGNVLECESVSPSYAMAEFMYMYLQFLCTSKLIYFSFCPVLIINRFFLYSHLLYFDILCNVFFLKLHI